MGVRYGIDGSWAYTTSFGNAVQIIPKKGRTFVFSSNNPEKICQIINTEIQAHTKNGWQRFEFSQPSGDETQRPT